MKHKVLSTKKLDASLVEQARQNNIEIIEQDFITIHPILSKEKWDEIFEVIENKKEYVVFTSSNAVNSLKKYLKDYINPFATNWKIFCLAGKTKIALEENIELFGKIVETAENASVLAEKITQYKIEEIVFFCGNKRRDELPSILKEAGVKIHEVLVYETSKTPVATTADIDAVIFFSPSAVQSFFSVNQLKEETVCFAIGKTTADKIQNHCENKTVASNFPSQNDLIKKLLNYFQTSLLG